MFCTWLSSNSVQKRYAPYSWFEMIHSAGSPYSMNLNGVDWTLNRGKSQCFLCFLTGPGNETSSSSQYVLVIVLVIQQHCLQLTGLMETIRNFSPFQSPVHSSALQAYRDSPLDFCPHRQEYRLIFSHSDNARHLL